MYREVSAASRGLFRRTAPRTPALLLLRWPWLAGFLGNTDILVKRMILHDRQTLIGQTLDCAKI